MEVINPNVLNSVNEEYRPIKEVSKYKIRPTVRVFVFDKDNNIGLIKPENAHIYFPPGGGIENGESLEDAVKREVAEELGVDCDYKKDIGVLEHYHEGWMTNFIIHHIYALSDRKETKIDYEEYDTNLERVWVNVDDYIKTLENYIKNINPNDVWSKAVFYFLSKHKDTNKNAK